MNEEETAENRTEEVNPPPRRPRRLLRSGDDRMIAGVAGGLGDYFDVDPVIFRIGLGVSIFFGGLGLIAYLALAVLVPSAEADGVRPAPAQRSRWIAAAAIVVGACLVLSAGGGFLFGGPDWGFLWIVALAGVGAAVYYAAKNTDGPIGIGRILLIALLTVVAIFALAALALVSAWATAEGGGAVMAALVIAAAVALVIGAFVGGARWLIVPALAIALPVGTVSAAGIELEGGYGQRHFEPISTEALPADGYELAAGQLLIDLRELDWSRERVVDLDVDQGLGQLVVAIPEDVCLEADAQVSAGAIDLDGNETDGLDVHDEAGIGTTQTPRLSLDAELDAGHVLVIGDDAAVLEGDWDDEGFGRDSNFDRASAPTECAA
jgi:phage shock protein PspC (stress-responsive transcriptional regulator)